MTDAELRTLLTLLHHRTEHVDVAKLDAAEWQAIADVARKVTTEAVYRARRLKVADVIETGSSTRSSRPSIPPPRR